MGTIELSRSQPAMFGDCRDSCSGSYSYFVLDLESLEISSFCSLRKVLLLSLVYSIGFVMKGRRLFFLKDSNVWKSTCFPVSSRNF